MRPWITARPGNLPSVPMNSTAATPCAPTVRPSKSTIRVGCSRRCRVSIRFVSLFIQPYFYISNRRREASMKIHEYQGKEILRKFGVTVPRGIPCMSADDAVKAAEELGGPVWVVKAQIHAGGRGKGGGVKVAKSIDQVREYANQIMGMQLITHQTSPEGQKVRRLLIEEGADIKKELYVSLVTDRVSQKVVLMASSEGGMDIEEVAEKHPELIHKVAIDPTVGLTDAEADSISTKIGIPAASIADARAQLKGLYKAY